MICPLKGWVWSHQITRLRVFDPSPHELRLSRSIGKCFYSPTHSPRPACLQPLYEHGLEDLVLPIPPRVGGSVQDAEGIPGFEGQANLKHQWNHHDFLGVVKEWICLRLNWWHLDNRHSQYDDFSIPHPSLMHPEWYIHRGSVFAERKLSQRQQRRPQAGSTCQALKRQESQPECCCQPNIDIPRPPPPRTVPKTHS